MTKINPMEVEKYLRDANYPCSKQELVDLAREEGADNLLVQTLQGMDRDRFESPVDVSEALAANQ